MLFPTASWGVQRLNCNRIRFTASDPQPPPLPDNEKEAVQLCSQWKLKTTRLAARFEASLKPPPPPPTDHEAELKLAKSKIRELEALVATNRSEVGGCPFVSYRSIRFAELNLFPIERAAFEIRLLCDCCALCEVAA